MWGSTVFFAMTIAVGKESQNSDIVRYMAQVTYLHTASFTLSSAYDYFKASNEIDILRTFLAIVVSRFTANGHILLLIYGVIFGYFFSRNIWFVLDRLKNNLKWVTILFVVCLFIITPIWSMGGFRFHVAIHVFIFGLFPFLFDGRKKSLLWCLSTPFIFHYSFILPLLVLTVYMVLGNRLMFYYVFFLISLLTSEINISRFNHYVELYAPQAFAERSESYRREAIVEEYREGKDSSTKTWHARYSKKGLKWPLIAFLIIIYWKDRDAFFQDPKLLRLLSFTFLFFGMANLISSIPSGGRFLAPASLLTVAFLAVYIQNNEQEQLIKKIIPLTLPLLGLYIIVTVREAFYFTSVTTIFGNPLIALFTIGDNISLNDLIK